jgi:hypothetical protein
MDRMMTHLCSALFREPVDPDRNGVPNCWAVFKRSINLGTIRRRLADNERRSIAAWNCEMNLIWGNADEFNCRDSVFTSLALEIRRMFEKEYKKLNALSIQKSTQTVGELKA